MGQRVKIPKNLTTRFMDDPSNDQDEHAPLVKGRLL